MAQSKTRFVPIIYVRGYAMTSTEIDDTTADPFCGFNLGSTVYRAVPDKKRQPRKFIFESPVIRLASEFGYSDVYEDGYDILDPEWSADKDNKITNRSIIIYRYYDSASSILGNSKRPDINQFARGLSELILKVRDLVCSNPKNETAPKDFNCYLVAHSMGGLVCRSFLQNPENDTKSTKQYVSKFFTYATPHNGIDVVGINVPKWFNMADADNFSRNEMSKYLKLESAYKKTDSVAWVPEDQFPPENVFCMVGTNRMDYEAAAGLSRTFVGHGSDGLVKIENATLRGISKSGTPGMPCAKAFTYRAHSGYFGIVNSEESYQNLTRFLFGDVRVDIWVEINDIKLPSKIQDEIDKSGNKVNALYQIETSVSPKGKVWQLTRRKAEEDSVACFTHQDWLNSKNKTINEYLSTVFLSNKARVNTRSPGLSYLLDLAIKAPDYEVDRTLWFNQHFEGSHLFRNGIQLEITPPNESRTEWSVKYGWQDQGFHTANQKIDPQSLKAGKIEISIDFDSNSNPGVRGKLRFIVSEWNSDKDS